MNIIFFATDACMVKPGNDSSGFLINKKYLFDTGYHLIGNMQKIGMEPDEIEHLFFTHLHHDHYMALPQILFWYLQKNKPLSKLNLYGPACDLRRVVDLAMRFLQAGADDLYYHDCEYPTLHELDPGDSFTLDDIGIETCASFHAIEGLSWRLTEQSTGKVLSLTGDTYYADSIAAALHDCDLLVQETALTTSDTDPLNPPGCRHSGIADGVRMAKNARAKRMFVIHFAASRADDVIAKAKTLTDIEVVYPERFVPYEV